VAQGAGYCGRTENLLCGFVHQAYATGTKGDDFIVANDDFHRESTNLVEEAAVNVPGRLQQIGKALFLIGAGKRRVAGIQDYRRILFHFFADVEHQHRLQVGQGKTHWQRGTQGLQRAPAVEPLQPTIESCESARRHRHRSGTQAALVARWNPIMPWNTVSTRTSTKPSSRSRIDKSSAV
jgi:hypothetical protein